MIPKCSGYYWARQLPYVDSMGNRITFPVQVIHYDMDWDVVTMHGRLDMVASKEFEFLSRVVCVNG